MSARGAGKWGVSRWAGHGDEERGGLGASAFRGAQGWSQALHSWATCTPGPRAGRTLQTSGRGSLQRRGAGGWPRASDAVFFSLPAAVEQPSPGGSADWG